MSRALWLALLVSLVLHGMLFLADISPLSEPEPLPPVVLQASLVPHSQNQELEPVVAAVEPVVPEILPEPAVSEVATTEVATTAEPEVLPEPETELPGSTSLEGQEAMNQPPDSVEFTTPPDYFLPLEPGSVRAIDPIDELDGFPPKGEIHYTVFRGNQGLEVGRATSRWVLGEGRYWLQSTTETSGLAAFLYPLQMEAESKGNFGAKGFVPETFRVLKNGRATNEAADFNWSEGEVLIGKSQTAYPLKSGSQDLLSLQFQFPFMADLLEGTSFRVATGKKYELLHFDNMGEEVLQTPAGIFKTLHLQALAETRTELWLALDHLLLPVKIRYTDKKGDVFEQVVTRIIFDGEEMSKTSDKPGLP